MEDKKTRKANLEYDRTTFLLLGFIVTLSTLFVAFEWENTKPLSPDWIGFSPAFIEQESVRIEEEPAETSSPKTVEVIVVQQKTISGEFNVVEEVVEEEVLSGPEEEIINTPPVAPVDTTGQIHTKTEVMPQFKGGYTGLIRFIYDNMAYPAIAAKQRIEGKIWCSFVINGDGSISDVQLEQGSYTLLNEEAMRVLGIMPAWEPGTIGGKPVKVRVYLPVVFKL